MEAAASGPDQGRATAACSTASGNQRSACQQLCMLAHTCARTSARGCDLCTHKCTSTCKAEHLSSLHMNHMPDEELCSMHVGPLHRSTHLLTSICLSDMHCSCSSSNIPASFFAAPRCTVVCYATLHCAVFLLCCAVYEAGRQGAAAQERWWAAGGHTALLLSSTAAKAGAVGIKRRRQPTEAAGDKENLR